MLLSSCASKEEPPINPDNMDFSISPGDDFYRFVNNGWLKNNPIPEEYSRYGAFEELEQLNNDRLNSLIEEITNDATAEEGSNRQKVRDFFNSGMNVEELNKLGHSPIQPILDDIWQVESEEDFTKLLAGLHDYGFRPFFRLVSAQDRMNTEMMIGSIFQSGLGMTDKDYYLKDDSRSLEIREAYKKMINEILVLAGYSEAEAKSKSEDIYSIEKKLAEASMSRIERRNPYATYNKMNINELRDISPSINWQLYFNARGLDIEELNIGMPDFINTVDLIWNSSEKHKLQNYLEWNVLRPSASFLGENFENTTFEFYGRVMSGREKPQERWKRVLQNINRNIGETIGQEYVAEFFPEEAKLRMEELVEYLRDAFKIRIEELDWMSDETKKKAINKLNLMNVKIGYPDEWVDYSDLEILSQPYILNVLEARRFNIRRNLDEIGKPVNRDKWFMNPQTVNAYYSPTMNEIVFPAAILQPPFFYLHGDDAVNFGAIGMVIGHEMTHGFDDHGRHYDADGRLNDWWTEDDSEKFQKRADILIDQYNNYVVLDTLTINGELSLGENIADLGGLSIAYTAFKLRLSDMDEVEEIDGFSPEQRFFISYAQVWRNNIRDQELIRNLQERPHSPGEARVNGVVYNMDAFYEHFSITPEDNRYIPKGERARIW